MVTWTTLSRPIVSRQQLAEFKASNFSDRGISVHIFGGHLTRDDTTALCYPGLKGLLVYGQLTRRKADAGILFGAIFDNKELELLNMNLHCSDWFLEYDKVMIRSFVLTTLRLLQTALITFPEKNLDVLGKSLRHKTVLEEVSAHGTRDETHIKYSKLL